VLVVNIALMVRGRRLPDGDERCGDGVEMRRKKYCRNRVRIGRTVSDVVLESDSAHELDYSSHFSTRTQF